MPDDAVGMVVCEYERGHHVLLGNTTLDYVTVARLSEVPSGQTLWVKPTRHDRLVLCNVGGAIYAVVDACSHDGGMLRFGKLDGQHLVCPRHGACFDVSTGEAVTPPATVAIRTYPVRVLGDEIQVGLEE